MTEVSKVIQAKILYKERFPVNFSSVSSLLSYLVLLCIYAGISFQSFALNYHIVNAFGAKERIKNVFESQV